MAQIIGITSEALQATIRRLLPSQQGFGEDLQASNVIQPIIDLTPSAEGETTPEYLQRAWDFSTGHNTVTNTTTQIINTPGFWQIDLAIAQNPSNNAQVASIAISDGLSSKVIWELNHSAGSTAAVFVTDNPIIAFLRTGDSLSVTSTGAGGTNCDVWYRQVADVNGNVVNPLGFSPQ